MAGEVETQGNETATNEVETTQETKTPVESTETIQAQGAEVAAPVVPPEYKPNYKFKVLDKELEIDEFLRGAIKDPDTEKKVRELYEKAHGLDHIKADRQTIRQELQAVKAEQSQVQESLETLSHFVRTDNLQAFFDALKIPEEKVLRYAYNRLQYREMSPEQRAQIDGQTQAEQQAYFLQKQNEELLKSVQQSAEQTRRTELEQGISRPEIAPIVQAFDARVGKPGAFMEEVIARGKYHWLANQKDISVEQAISEVLTLLGQQAQGAPQVQSPVLNLNGQSGSEQVPGKPQPKPVIPNIRGNGSSPAKKVPRSLDDLRKIAAEKSA